MGHNFEDTTNSYFRIDPKTAKEDYIDVVKQLSTDKVDVQVIDKYEDLLERIEQLELPKVQLNKRIKLK